MGVLFAQGCTYQVHAFDGLSGQFPLTYGGQINGRHWWSGNISNAPDALSFTFNNTNGWEGEVGEFDRDYRRSDHAPVVGVDDEVAGGPEVQLLLAPLQRIPEKDRHVDSPALGVHEPRAADRQQVGYPRKRDGDGMEIRAEHIA
jgi:hypothetical protein